MIGENSTEHDSQHPTPADDFHVLVLAKAPRPGYVKTRLSPPLTPAQSADVAQGALLDTLASALEAVDGDGRRLILAWRDDAPQDDQHLEIGHMLQQCLVIEQRGDTFARRLVNAHADAAALRPSRPVIQIGMDTPQVTATQLRQAAFKLGTRGNAAVLGPAVDGGWWLLGLSEPSNASVLLEVAMSTATTSAETAAALQGTGATIHYVEPMRDVDTWTDAVEVAPLCMRPNFAQAVSPLHRHLRETSDWSIVPR